jgi:hypothetical protein
MMKVDLTGAKQWDQRFGNYPGGINQFYGLEEGRDELIFNECFGIAPRYADDLTTQNGFVISCGIGIEGCTNWQFSPSLWAECKTDPRKTWRSLTIATDLDGNRVYSRMDNYQSSTEVGWKSGSTGNEYIFSLADGGHAIITDEALGMGIGKIAQYADSD